MSVANFIDSHQIETEANTEGKARGLTDHQRDEAGVVVWRFTAKEELRADDVTSTIGDEAL